MYSLFLVLMVVIIAWEFLFATMDGKSGVQSVIILSAKDALIFVDLTFNKK
jgi:hypothetical protein